VNVAGDSLAGVELGRYCASLDAGAAEKERAVAPWISRATRGDILDVGSGTGALACRLANRFSRVRIVGIDSDRRMLAEARRQRTSTSAVEFRPGSALEPQSTRAAAVVFCSILHEVYSYHGDSLSYVAKALRAAHDSLATGGRIVIRDFVRPAAARRRVLLCHRRSDIVPGHDFRSFSEQFGRAVRFDGSFRDTEAVYYRTDLGSAYEFLARKDFHEMWSRELSERYGFWDESEARALGRDAGFRLVHSRAMQDEWVLENSLRGNARLLSSESGIALPFPPRHLTVVGEKE
jgi:SAM-dependent methyltransferase